MEKIITGFKKNGMAGFLVTEENGTTNHFPVAKDLSACICRISRIDGLECQHIKYIKENRNGQKATDKAAPTEEQVNEENNTMATATKKSAPKAAKKASKPAPDANKVKAAKPEPKKPAARKAPAAKPAKDVVLATSTGEVLATATGDKVDLAPKAEKAAKASKPEAAAPAGPTIVVDGKYGLKTYTIVKEGDNYVLTGKKGSAYITERMIADKTVMKVNRVDSENIAWPFQGVKLTDKDGTLRQV